MNDSKQLSASRTISAPAGEIFALLADPYRHQIIDGSGMLRGPDPDAKPVTGVGQTFTMKMHHPQLGGYQMINTVTTFEPGTRIGWAPGLDPSCGEVLDKLGVGKVGGHTFTYELNQTGEQGTVVTETYDWSGVDDPGFAKLCPVVTEQQLAETLEKIAQHVE